MLEPDYNGRLVAEWPNVTSINFLRLVFMSAVMYCWYFTGAFHFKLLSYRLC